ncbi:MAG TPA: hypothetical protein PLH93_12365 [Flavobacteriales bacterium]|nr:hypothetical protein [Flavobacteriales bacterium]
MLADRLLHTVLDLSLADVELPPGVGVLDPFNGPHGAEVRRIVTTQFERGTALLKERFADLTTVAEALLEHESLDGTQILQIVRGEKMNLPPVPPPAPPPVVAETEAEKPEVIAPFLGPMPEPKLS